LCLDDCFATTTMPQLTEITQFIFGQPLRRLVAKRYSRLGYRRSPLGFMSNGKGWYLSLTLWLSTIRQPRTPTLIRFRSRESNVKMLPEPTIAYSPIRTKHGEFTIYVFSWSKNEQDNVLCLTSPTERTHPPLVRVQSACYTGEIFASLDCDCHWQLETSLAAVQKEGGLFIYMLKDGRGAGLLAKICGLGLSHELGIDTADAYLKLGIPYDPRDYEQAAYVLKHFGISCLRLLTNNPRKVNGLVNLGFNIERVRLESTPTEHNRDYLRAKALKLGHLMQTFGTDPTGR
jgi:GTP cyclohydrolase II